MAESRRQPRNGADVVTELERANRAGLGAMHGREAAHKSALVAHLHAGMSALGFSFSDFSLAEYQLSQDRHGPAAAQLQFHCFCTTERHELEHSVRTLRVLVAVSQAALLLCIFLAHYSNQAQVSA